MNQLEIIDAVKGGLMWIGLGVLLLIAAACAAVGLHRVSKALCVRLHPAAIGGGLDFSIFSRTALEPAMRMWYNMH